MADKLARSITETACEEHRIIFLLKVLESNFEKEHKFVERNEITLMIYKIRNKEELSKVESCLLVSIVGILTRQLLLQLGLLEKKHG